MKLKGVNAFEQHIEKIVLISVAVVFLVVLAMQFLLEPNQVKVTDSPPVAPGKAFLAVETKARELKAQMEAPAEGVLPEVPKYDLVNQLQARRTQPLAAAGAKTLVLGVAPKIEGSRGDVQVTGVDRIQALDVPAPAKVTAVNYSNTFSPTEPVNTPELKALLPQEQPLDKHSVSVAAAFDGTALKANLAKGDGGSKAMPPNWYRDSLGLLAVKLQRQEQNADGTWGEVADVAPPPGRYNLFEALKGVRGPTDLSDLIAEAASATDELLRPDFYEIIAGQPFKAPLDLSAAAGAAIAAAPKEVQDLVRERKDKVASVERLTKQRADLEKTSVGPRNTPGGGGGGGGKGAGGGGGGGGGEGAAREQERRQREHQQRLENFDRQIKQAEDRIAAIDAKLTELGFDADGKPGAPAAAPPGQANAASQSKPLLEDPDVRIWTHDMTVMPGKTYRYRMLVAVNNPAFARTSALVKEQQDLAASPVVYSAPSAWSDPIQVMADQYYFVTSAQEADNLGPSRATAEVFRFFYGYYRRGAVNLEPGDTITASIKLPDVNKLPIYDVAALQNGILPPAPGVAPPPVAPQPAPRNPREGGGSKGGNLAPPPGEERPGAQPGGEAGKAVLPPNSKPFAKPSITAAFDLLLLDVTKSLGYSGDAQPHAYFRGEKGKIVVCIPEEERKQAVWTIVGQSAKDGETQGVTTPTESKDQKAPGPKQTPKEKAPKVNPGSGGGGGGTG